MNKQLRGFTLVEVLVALFVMALLAAMAWRGVDGIARARTNGQERMELTLRLDTVLTQWEQDLAAVHDAVVVPPLSFNGAALRLTRRTEGGVQLVMWSLRNGEWLRWAGPAVTRAADLQDQWMRSQQLLGTEPQQLHAIKGVESWQLYCFWSGAWANCQSTGNLVQQSQQSQQSQQASPPRQQLPSGVRLLLNFSGSPLQGSLTREVVIPPS